MNSLVLLLLVFSSVSADDFTVECSNELVEVVEGEDIEFDCFVTKTYSSCGLVRLLDGGGGGQEGGCIFLWKSPLQIEGGSCSPPELEDRAGFVGKPMYEIREVGGESVGGYLCRIRLGRAAAETDSGEWAVEAEDDGFWTKDIGRDVVQVKVMPRPTTTTTTTTPVTTPLAISVKSAALSTTATPLLIFMASREEMSEEESKEVDGMKAKEDTSCFLGDHSFSGLDVNVTYYISSPADCHRLCLLHRRCRLWTWADPQHEPRHGGACWLKSHGAIDSLKPHRGFTSGPKHCPLCFQLGVRLRGGVHAATRLSVETASECQRECRTRRGCNFFSMDVTGKRCELKVSFRREEEGSGWVSGPNSCPKARWSLWSSWSLNCFDQDVPSFGRPDCGPKIGRRFRRRECITDDAGENCEGEGGEDGEELQWTDCLLPFVECTTSTTSPPPIEGRNGGGRSLNVTGSGIQSSLDDSAADNNSSSTAVVPVLVAVAVLMLLMLVAAAFVVSKRGGGDGHERSFMSSVSSRIPTLSLSSAVRGMRRKVSPSSSSDGVSPMRGSVSSLPTRRGSALRRLSLTHSLRMVPSPDSPDVDRRPVEAASLPGLVLIKDSLPGAKEFAALNDLDHRQHVAVFSTDVGRGYTAKNSPGGGMNRYSNILPYDRNRVVLRTPVQSCDYVNASWIRPRPASSTSIQPGERMTWEEAKRRKQQQESGGEKRSFIAAQGPLPNTLPHFLQMILENDVKLVIMLTSTRQKNETTGLMDPKCEQYWPDHPREELVFGDITVKLDGEEERSDKIEGLTRRSIVLEKEAGSETDCPVHSFVQLHFTEWPDFGVTESPAPLVALAEVTIQEAAKREEEQGRVTLVHCSAGVGRTGTFIALLGLMRDIDEMGEERAKPVDVFRTTLELRRERGQMVQRKAQYRLLYQSIAWYIRSKEKKGGEEGKENGGFDSEYVYYGN